ncbi:MAG: T9SS type A sorting domain-containing protein [Bacteroidales bacterium]
MKIGRNRFFITILGILAILSNSNAQETIILDGFVGVPQSQQIQLRWVISAGQTCNGIFIERSTDTLHWQNIGDIPGVCGSSSTPVPYNFIDTSPMHNSMNYYRLELGGQGYSPVINVPFYDFSSKGYVLIPNPVHEIAMLYFGTSTTETFDIAFFDASGKLVQKLSGVGGNCKVDASQLKPAIYFFVIERKGKSNVLGKLVVR